MLSRQEAAALERDALLAERKEALAIGYGVLMERTAEGWEIDCKQARDVARSLWEWMAKEPSVILRQKAQEIAGLYPWLREPLETEEAS